MSLDDITDKENRKSIEALELLEKGIPGAIVAEAALQRGLDRELYDASRVAAARAAYPAKKDEWLKNVGKSAIRPQSNPDDQTKRYDFVVDTLNVLLGDTGEALKPDNFAKYRPVIEGQLFPAAEALGLDVGQIKVDYQMELMQSSGGPNNPSAGRLGYIKGHLRELQERVRQHKS